MSLDCAHESLCAGTCESGLESVGAKAEDDRTPEVFVRVVEVAWRSPSEHAGEVIPFCAIYDWIRQHHQGLFASDLLGLTGYPDIAQSYPVLQLRGPGRDLIGWPGCNQLP